MEKTVGKPGIGLGGLSKFQPKAETEPGGSVPPGAELALPSSPRGSKTHSCFSCPAGSWSLAFPKPGQSHPLELLT